MQALEGEASPCAPDNAWEVAMRRTIEVIRGYMLATFTLDKTLGLHLIDRAGYKGDLRCASLPCQ